MFRYLGWTEAADLIIKVLHGAIGSPEAAYDFARQRTGASELKCPQFGDSIVVHI
jgi:isocitrate dehydrogenase